MFKILMLIALISSTSIFATSISKPSKEQKTLDKYILDKNFKLLGKTTFSILFWDLYESKLLTTSGLYPIKQEYEKLVYEIHYLADISSKDLIKRTVEQWEHLKVPKAQYQHYLTDLKLIWPDIKKGDTLSLLIDEGKSAFYFNDRYIGIINDSEFGQLFLDIWLSENTSEPSLRLDLLGKNSNE